MKTLRHAAASVIVAVGIVIAFLFLIATASVIEAFQLYPHDGHGGVALFLIELVVILFTASVGGLLCFHYLHARCKGLQEYRYLPSRQEQRRR